MLNLRLKTVYCRHDRAWRQRGIGQQGAANGAQNFRFILADNGTKNVVEKTFASPWLRGSDTGRLQRLAHNRLIKGQTGLPSRPMLRLQQRTIADASPVATDLARGQAVVASDLFMCDEERGRYHREAIALDPVLRKATLSLQPTRVALTASWTAVSSRSPSQCASQT